MPKREDPEPASSRTAERNVREMMREGVDPWKGLSISQKLRKELAEKGLKGFKRGGIVKKTGVAKLHKGERVLTVKQSKAHTARRAAPRRKR